jgi:hypothetical protein
VRAQTSRKARWARASYGREPEERSRPPDSWCCTNCGRAHAKVQSHMDGCCEAPEKDRKPAAATRGMPRTARDMPEDVTRRAVLGKYAHQLSRQPLGLHKDSHTTRSQNNTGHKVLDQRGATPACRGSSRVHSCKEIRSKSCSRHLCTRCIHTALDRAASSPSSPDRLVYGR